MYDYLIVGAGLSGCTLAERLARVKGARVLIIDQRDHIAGNTYDPLNENGIRIHQYGPHIFHTNSSEVVAYLSNFTTWRPYDHRVLARVNGKLVPIPINRTTVNTLYGLNLDEAGVEAFLRERAEPLSRITNSEETVVSKVGRELYELFFRGYTRKQWGRDPRTLDPTVCGRIPTRANDDDRYFTDSFQAMPSDGFAAMCARMLDHPLIDILTGTSYQKAANDHTFNHVIFTGPVDEFFEYRYGRLPYRSLNFAMTTLNQRQYQPVGCINEPDESVPYTRTTEFAHITGEWGDKTVICREYPTDIGDPYYPIPAPENRELYRRYQQLAARQKYVTFVGRLAEYRYFNMDQVVASALATFKDLMRSEPAQLTAQIA